MMFPNKFVKGNIVLHPPFYPFPSHSPSLKVNYLYVRQKNNTGLYFPGPDTQICLFKKEEKLFIKTT